METDPRRIRAAIDAGQVVNPDCVCAECKWRPVTGNGKSGLCESCRLLDRERGVDGRLAKPA